MDFRSVSDHHIAVQIVEKSLECLIYEGKILIDSVNLQMQIIPGTTCTSSFILPDDWEIEKKRRKNSRVIDKVPVLFQNFGGFSLLCCRKGISSYALAESTCILPRLRFHKCTCVALMYLHFAYACSDDIFAIIKPVPLCGH